MATDHDLMLRASWAHLIEGRTQDSIAQSLGLTRAKVNRLIAECREAGLIHFVIAHDARIALREEDALKQRFGLADAWVVPQADTEAGAVRKVGAAAGTYVSNTLETGQTLAIGWGRTLDASVAGVQPRMERDNHVVTLLGSMVRGNGISSFDIASRYARTLNSDCCYLIAPRVSATIEEAMLLRRSQHVREAIEIAAGADIVLIGADDLSVSSTLCHTGQFSAPEIAELSSAGAVCILQGEALDREGTPISHPHASRTVTLELARFTKIPTRIVAAAGERKVKSLLAILKGGYCNVLVTDEPTARKLLDS